nr:intracellular protein transport protein USO1-like [Quercus suber]POE91519.1 hypothetical protein CFP56_14627 [Quercus suber]
MVPAPAYTASTNVHEKLYTQSLNSHALELKCERQATIVELLAKDEDIRQLRIDIHVLEDDYDDLRNLLTQEEDRSDKFEQLVNSNLLRAEEAEGQLQQITEELRIRENDLATLEAEKNALRHTTADATAALTEKLALTRELSVLKPELEHLKAQAASTEQLMTDKLALQRQLSEIQCDVENARREAKRALAKRRNTGVEIAQEEQMEDLRRQLAKEKRARARAEEAADVSQADLHVDDVRRELAQEKRARQKAEEKLEEAQSATQVEDVRRDLLQEKKLKDKLYDQVENLQIQLEKEKKAAARAAKRADGISNADEQAEDLREELAKEKKARGVAEKRAEAAERNAEKAENQMIADVETKKAALDKLDQFRSKLRTTKDRLKEVEAELELARAATTKAPTKKTSNGKPPHKRNAAQMDTDATTLGTPGDGPATKRSRAAAGVGDKSTFSITPFLNKTTSVINGSDDEEAETGSPAAAKTRKPLSQQPASKSNIPPKAPVASRKPKAPQLEMVTEERDDDDDDEEAGQESAGATKIRLKTGDEPENAQHKAKARKRKSIHDFKSFAAEPEMKKKKRKLGGLGKTLFDEEDDEDVGAAPTTRGMPGRKVFGSKGFGILGGGKKAGGLLGGGGGGAAGGGAKFGSTLLEGSGMNFSPLKRSRKVNLDDTLRG